MCTVTWNTTGMEARGLRIGLPGVQMFLGGIQFAMFDVLQNNACVCSAHTGVNALDSSIGALVSARRGRRPSPLIGPTSFWRKEHLPIS
jgi:hypothetical protein